MSRLHANEQSEKYSTHHTYNRQSGQIEFVTQNDQIFEILKNVHSLCGEVFLCTHCKYLHISIKYYNIFLGFSLCALCADAIDSVSSVPFVITNKHTGERHGLMLQLLK
ncbi:MAG: hypothetical protein ACE5J2_06560 [Nitrososphaerales archaeon]